MPNLRILIIFLPSTQHAMPYKICCLILQRQRSRFAEFERGGFQSFSPLEIIVIDIGKRGGVPEALEPSPGNTPEHAYVV